VSVAFLFPGQGSQTPGMLHALPNHPVVAQTLDEASQALGQNVLELDSAVALQSTVSVQLALLASGVAVARALLAEGIAPEAVGGMSAGAFSAAVVAGVLNLGDAVGLVKQRAEMTVQLYPEGYGLSAIVGLTEKQVVALVEEAFTEQKPVYVANINAPRQIVIAGSNEAMDKVLQAASKSGARKAEHLKVAQPSHCRLLQPVADALSNRLKTLSFEQPRMIYVGNVTGRVLRSTEAIAQDFASNIAHTVRWHDMTTVMEELGCRLFLEMPPGHVLARLAAEAFPDSRALAVSEAPLSYVLRVARAA
jgi:malonate decarboxylase epsilon subunit